MPDPGSSARDDSPPSTDTHRYEPLRSNNDQTPDGTVRRSRPRGSAGYGTISSNLQAEQQPSLGDAARRSSRAAVGTTPDVSSPRPRLPSRRNTSKYQTPHRGQEFSADDDLQDVENDAEQAKQKATSTQTLRRRGTGLAPLSKIESGEEGDVTRQRKGPTARVTSPPRAIESSQQEEQADRAPVTDMSEDEDLSGADTTVPPADEMEEAEVEVESSDTNRENENDEDEDEDEDEDDDMSDAESFTLKDRQQAINQTHPFGIRIWKPALYKKNRSVEKTAEGDIHSTPGGYVSNWIRLFNLLWTVLFGWWLALITAASAIVCLGFGLAPSDRGYSRVMFGLAAYLFYPFGKFVKLHQDEAYADEDEGEGRSISEYEQWQSGDIEDGRLFFGPSTSHSRSLVGRRRESLQSADENDSLLSYSRTGGGTPVRSETQTKRRFFGRGQWTLGRVAFYVMFYTFVGPLLLLVSVFCWFMVFTIPMGRVTSILWTHLRRHPLALSFHKDASFARSPTDEPASILLCTYRAVGSKYWKYTIDGTNIFLINLLAIVLFTIFDYFVLEEFLHLEIWLTNTGFMFTLALFSIMPLAYFIGQAVASISAQSSMGLGAAINAFFSTLVEVFLYCVALNQGKAQLVEGSIVGSLFAGLLLLPGLSMCFGAIQRKTQRFNVKSAGVTSTMLLFAVIAAFGPTLFYKIHGSHELTCRACFVTPGQGDLDEECRRCFFSQRPAVTDRFFVEAVRPYCWFAAIMLFLSYVIGLLFTLRTHAAVIWNEAPEDKKLQSSMIIPGSLSASQPTIIFRADDDRDRERTAAEQGASSTSRGPVRDDQLYQRILGQSLKQMGLPNASEPAKTAVVDNDDSCKPKHSTPHRVPPKQNNETLKPIEGLSKEQSSQIMQQMAQFAASAVALAARDSSVRPRRVRIPSHVVVGAKAPEAISSAAHDRHHEEPGRREQGAIPVDAHAPADGGGGHDAPNWGTVKSYVVLLGATILYAVIAEILVNTVDAVLQGGGDNFRISEKFLGITLFALVPNTTEFLNAISFAMNGNIALSMEIGSAYALQVCLLQIPALVLFSAVNGRFIDDEVLVSHTFNLIFPQWDMVTVILCVFLLSYVYGEGKSNYFKGSILVLTYLVILVGFWQAGLSDMMDFEGIDRFEQVVRSVPKTFKTVGQFSSGQAF